MITVKERSEGLEINNMFCSFKIQKLEDELGIDHHSSSRCRPLIHDCIKSEEYLGRLREIKNHNFPEYIKFPGVCRFNILDLDLNNIEKEVSEENRVRDILFNQVLEFIENSSKIDLIDYKLFEKCEKKFVIYLLALINYFLDYDLPKTFRYEYYNLQEHRYYTNNYLLNDMEVTEDMIQDLLTRPKDFLIFIKSPDYPIYSSSFDRPCNVYLLLKRTEFNTPDYIKLCNNEFSEYEEEYNIIKVSYLGLDNFSYIDFNENIDPDTKNLLDTYMNLALNDWKV